MDKIDTHFSWPRKHFFASKIVLQVIACCLRGVGFMSSSRRSPRSFHRTVFFGHRWPFFVSWNFSFVTTFSSRRRNGLVSSLRNFQVLTSSVFLFVNWATYKTAMSQLFPPSLHEAPPGQNNMVKKVTEVVFISKDALAKIENKSEEQQPSTPLGGLRGWPRGPWPPPFPWNFVLFLLNSQKNKKYL